MDPDTLDIATIVPHTEAEGPGERFALWVQGCPMRCPGCCNPEFLRFGAGTRRAVRSVVDEALAAHVEGVSVLGGEPFAQAPALARLAEAVRAEGLSVMVYTGYTLAELRAADAPTGAAALLAHTDLLVDGRYDEARRTTSRRWIGSDNQVLHFLSSRYDPADPRFREPNTVELRLVNGRIVLNGWPVDGARTRVEVSPARRSTPR